MVLTTLTVLIAVAIAVLVDPKKAKKIACTSHQMQMGLSFQIWRGDHADTFPMGLSITNGGSRENVRSGQVVSTFQLISNELVSAPLLWCPADRERWPAKTFGEISNSNLSYFANVDVTNVYEPQAILFGDSDFLVNAKPVKSGLLSLRAGDSIAWQPVRHGLSGNLGMADGSVQSISAGYLLSCLIPIGSATNRLAIP